MICAPAEGRPAFRVGAWDRNGREHSEDGADDHPLKNPSKLASLCRAAANTVSPRKAHQQDGIGAFGCSRRQLRQSTRPRKRCRLTQQYLIACGSATLPQLSQLTCGSPCGFSEVLGLWLRVICGASSIA